MAAHTDNSNSIAVVGPGAIGCLFAALLMRSGRKVFLVDKDPERAEQLNQLVLEDESGSQAFSVCTCTRPQEEMRPELILICVKSYDTAAAIQQALPFVGPETIVASLQNGLGNIEQIAPAIAPELVVGVITSQGASSLGMGHVRHAGDGPTTVVPFADQKSQSAVRVSALLQACGMEVILSDDAASAIWGKVVVNAGINPVTALWDIDNGQVLAQEEPRLLAMQAGQEAAEVAAGLGVQLPYNDVESQIAMICRRTSCNVSSMRQDVRQGRRTEIEAINGAVVEKAHQLGISVPTNEQLLNRIREL